MEEPSKQFSPEEIAQIEKSRTISDADLLKGGAGYNITENGDKTLHATESQKKVWGGEKVWGDGEDARFISEFPSADFIDFLNSVPTHIDNREKLAPSWEPIKKKIEEIATRYKISQEGNLCICPECTANVLDYYNRRIGLPSEYRSRVAELTKNYNTYLGPLDNE
jgi:hypothetical protein